MNTDSLVHDLLVEATSLPPKDSTSFNVVPKILESKEPMVDAMTQTLKNVSLGAEEAVATALYTEQDAEFMREALIEADKCLALGEVPVGAVIVKDGVIIARGHNTMISGHDPSAHAEMAAIRMAAVALKNYRLCGTTLYVTLEPCMMCTGAIIHARIDRVVYGAQDPKTGAHTSAFTLLQNSLNNHYPQVVGGVLGAQCSQSLSAFFKRRRQEHKEAKKAKQAQLLNATALESNEANEPS